MARSYWGGYIDVILFPTLRNCIPNGLVSPPDYCISYAHSIHSDGYCTNMCLHAYTRGSGLCILGRYYNTTKKVILQLGVCRVPNAYLACRFLNNCFNWALFARLTSGKEPFAPSTRKLPSVPADTPLLELVNKGPKTVSRHRAIPPC